MEEYTATRKEPYTLEYFNIDKSMRVIPLYKSWAEKIDEFVKQEIIDNNFKDTIESYRDIVTNIVNSLNLSPQTNSRTVLEKLYKWVTKIVGPQRRLDRRKQEILHGKLR